MHEENEFHQKDTVNDDVIKIAKNTYTKSDDIIQNGGGDISVDIMNGTNGKITKPLQKSAILCEVDARKEVRANGDMNS